MLKSLIRSSILLLAGAGLGIWFAPPKTRDVMKLDFALAQAKAKDFHSRVSSKWVDNAQHSLNGAAKQVDFKKLNRKQFNQWINSVKTSYDNISEQASRTQKSLAAVDSYLKNAKDEVHKQRKMLGI